MLNLCAVICHHNRFVDFLFSFCVEDCLYLERVKKQEVTSLSASGPRSHLQNGGKSAKGVKRRGETAKSLNTDMATLLVNDLNWDDLKKLA